PSIHFPLWTERPPGGRPFGQPLVSLRSGPSGRWRASVRPTACVLRSGLIDPKRARSANRLCFCALDRAAAGRASVRPTACVLRSGPIDPKRARSANRLCLALWTDRSQTGSISQPLVFSLWTERPPGGRPFGQPLVPCALG